MSGQSPDIRGWDTVPPAGICAGLSPTSAPRKFPHPWRQRTHSQRQRTLSVSLYSIVMTGFIRPMAGSPW